LKKSSITKDVVRRRITLSGVMNTVSASQRSTINTKRIVGIINSAFELSRSGGTDEKLAGTLDDLRHYTITHFSYEEQINGFRSDQSRK
jgi:hypothetical protein